MICNTKSGSFIPAAIRGIHCGNEGLHPLYVCGSCLVCKEIERYLFTRSADQVFRELINVCQCSRRLFSGMERTALALWYALGQQEKQGLVF